MDSDGVYATPRPGLLELIVASMNHSRKRPVRSTGAIGVAEDTMPERIVGLNAWLGAMPAALRVPTESVDWH